MSSKIKNHDLDRITYKDYKGQFKIIIDNMPSKQICFFIINKYKNNLVVGDKEFQLSSISSKEITKYKRFIIKEAVKHL